MEFAFRILQMMRWRSHHLPASAVRSQATKGSVLDPKHWGFFSCTQVKSWLSQLSQLRSVLEVRWPCNQSHVNKVSTNLSFRKSHIELPKRWPRQLKSTTPGPRSGHARSYSLPRASQPRCEKRSGHPAESTLEHAKMKKDGQKTSRFFLLALPFLWEHHSLARPPLPRIAWNFLELKTSQRCSKYRLPHPVGLLWKPKNSLPWAFLGCLLSVGSSMWAATEWPNPCPTWSLMCAVFCIASIVWFYIQRYLWTFPVKRFSDAS